MIAQLHGTVVRRTTGYIVLNVGGVGYRLFGPPELLCGQESILTAYTYLAVRDNALDLYGFTTQEDVDFFEELLGVSGVGPKSALSIISVAPANVLRRAIARANATELHSVYGIGKKVSEKLVLELKDKCAKHLESSDELVAPGQGDVIEALVALGYKADTARTVVLGLPAEYTKIEDQIKEALKRLP